MGIEYRLATPADLTRTVAVFAAAIDDLDRRHGFFESPTPSSTPNPAHAFWLGKDPAAFWVAEDRSDVVGYSFSYLRGSLWFLADLFVKPRYQGKGVGRTLIERTLGSWKGKAIANRAVVTPAFNPQSVSLYMRFGMFPRQPLYFASATRKDVAKSLVPTRSTSLRAEEVTGSAADRLVLSRVHRLALGIPPGWHNELFFDIEKARCLLFRKGGRPEGYAFLRRDGRIGPLVVRSESSFRPALEATLRSAADGDSKDVTIFFPGTNEEAAGAGIRHGFKITYPLQFLSSRPMGDWKNYMFCTPGLM